MKEIDVTRVFARYSFSDRRTSLHRFSNHVLIYVYSGELEICEPGSHQHLQAGECAFIGRGNRVFMTAIPRSCNPFHMILLPLPRSFLCEFYHAININSISAMKNRKITLNKLPMSAEIKSLFESFLPFISHSQEVPDDLVRLKMAEAAYVLMNLGYRFHSTIFDFSRPNELTMMEVVSCPYINELQWNPKLITINN